MQAYKHCIYQYLCCNNMQLCLQIIGDYYKDQREKIVSDLHGKTVHVSGDGRCDRPGHSALYGMYSLMDNNSKKILSLHVLKVQISIVIGAN